MTPGNAHLACESAVRQFDPDRYFSSLFAPGGKRHLLFALYAFNHEIARAAEVAREPMMAEIRLQWWRDAVQEAGAGRPRAHPVAIGLMDLLACNGIIARALESLIDARGEEISSAPFANLAALESHAEATSGTLMRTAAKILNGDTRIDELAREAGIAYGLAGILRSIPFHAARGKNFLPADLVTAEGEKAAISQVVRAAWNHFDHARAQSLPKTNIAAILPASLVPAYLSRVARHGRSDVSLFRRQLILLRAAALGKL